jgi:pimeloyl-ACP methyl ester carboxylesterase
MSTYPSLTAQHRQVPPALRGKVFFPHHDGFDEARRAWNLAVDQRPAVVAFPESAHDVTAVVRFAAQTGHRIAAQGTGHSAASLGHLDDTILVKTERMRGIHIDPRTRLPGLLDALGIERCVLGGMSMGGFMALRHPDRLNAMILIDSMASAPLSPNEGFFQSLKDSGPLSEAVAQRNADILFGITTRSHRPELVEAWKARWRELTGDSVYWETASWLRREDLSSRLGEISVPTLVIHGEEDTIIPIAAGEEMADGVQNGRFVHIANVGHTPNLEDPDAVNAAISDFVESLVLAP